MTPLVDDIWQGLSASMPEGATGTWMKHGQFEQLASGNEALWEDIKPALQSKLAKPRVFVGERDHVIEFLLFHHTVSAELGIWLDPSRRGQGLAPLWLRAALARIDWSLNPLLMATCPDLESHSARTFLSAGFRVMAQQENQVILCHYRP